MLLVFLVIVLTGCSSDIKLENWKVRVLKSGYGPCETYFTTEQAVVIALSVKNIGEFSNGLYTLELTLIDSSGNFYRGGIFSTYGSHYSDFYACQKDIAVSFNSGANLNIVTKSDILPGEEDIVLFIFMTDDSEIGTRALKLRIQEEGNKGFGVQIIAEKTTELSDLQRITLP